jgi:hypothetical protein
MWSTCKSDVSEEDLKQIGVGIKSVNFICALEKEQELGLFPRNFFRTSRKETTSLTKVPGPESLNPNDTISWKTLRKFHNLPNLNYPSRHPHIARVKQSKAKWEKFLTSSHFQRSFRKCIMPFTLLHHSYKSSPSCPPVARIWKHVRKIHASVKT